MPFYIPLTPLCISELIANWYKVWTPNKHPCHNLPRAYGTSKSMCMFWIRPTKYFLEQPRTRIRINELLSNQYQSTIVKHHTNNSKLGGWTHKHRISPYRVLILKYRTSGINQNQFFSWLNELEERSSWKEVM